MALRAVVDHPKFFRLKVLLGLNKSCTLGYLEALWHFCGRFTPQGNIGKYSDADIEAWLEWNGEPGALIRAFKESRWLDESTAHRILVHDWHQHADDATKKSLFRHKLSLITPCLPTVETPARHVPDISRPPEPVPEPVPEQEKQNHVEPCGSTSPDSLEEDLFLEPPPKKRDHAERTAVAEVFEHYRRKTGRNSAYTLTSLRMSKGLSRLREARSVASDGSIETAVRLMIAVVDELTGRPWNRGANPQKTRYLEWEDHIFASEEQFQKLLNAVLEKEIPHGIQPASSSAVL